MASLKIHQDIFAYERKRKGFTTRQITSIVIAFVLCVGTMVIMTYSLDINYIYSLSIGMCLAFPALICGFMPVFNLPAEEFASRFIELNKRGNAICWESIEIPNPHMSTTKQYKKQAKSKGFELTSYE